MRCVPATLLLVAAAGCVHQPRRAVAPALGQEAELVVLLEPLPPAAERLRFSIAAIALEGAGGSTAALELLAPPISQESAAQRPWLARGRVPPGDYSALLLRVGDASLAGDERPAALLVPEEPVRVPVALRLGAGAAAVVALSYRHEGSVPEGVRFAPALFAATPRWPVPARAAWATVEGSARVALLDRTSHELEALLPTGRGPAGLALDARSERAFVALPEEDRLEVYDMASATSLGRIRLLGGDLPTELELVPARHALLVLARGAQALVFVDPDARLEVARVAVGDDPVALAVEPGGQRAFVLGRRAGTVTVVDLANRVVVATRRTDPEPTRAVVTADGRQLYVAHAGSPDLAVYALPDVAPQRRLHVGLGAVAVALDPRSELVFVAREEEPRLLVFDTLTALPVDAIPLPAPATSLSVDAAEAALLAVLPSAGALAVIDLVGRRPRAVVRVGEAPYQALVAPPP
jgi:hypothetical protein